MMIMSDTSRTTPKRVLRRAAELGVHPDCVAADYDGACSGCIEIFNNVFHEFYGDSEDAAEALLRIVDDLLDD